jgi:DNA topoisomerase-3
VKEKEHAKADGKTKTKTKDQGKAQAKEEMVCPRCGKGKLMKGKAAWGCSEWKDGCRFTISFKQFEKKLTDKQITVLVSKKKSPLIKGFVFEGLKIDGRLALQSDQSIQLQPEISGQPDCPKCGNGKIMKGKTAWGCSNFKVCGFRVPFEIG